MPVQVVEVPDTVEVSIADAAIIDVYPPGSTSVEVVVGEGGGGIDTNDPRLSDERVPVNGSVTQAKLNSALDAALARVTDPRFTDERVPVNGSVTDAKVAAGAAIVESKLALASDAPAATPSRRTLGTGATQAAAGNDARLSDQRVPTDGSVTLPKLAVVGGTDGQALLRDSTLTGGLKFGATSPGSWSLYTPSLLAATTNPTLGTGSAVEGRYCQHGTIVHVSGKIQFGTSGVAAGSGIYEITLPIAAKEGQLLNGSGYIYDNSANDVRLIHLVLVPGQPLRFFPRTGAGTNYATASGTPWTWAASDSLSWAASYEVA